MERKTMKKQKKHLLGQREEVDETAAAKRGDGRWRSVSFEKQSCISYIYTIYEGGGTKEGKQRKQKVWEEEVEEEEEEEREEITRSICTL
ncbi:hypothetical protein AAC387_Pa04g1086 [Persea americana]